MLPPALHTGAAFSPPEYDKWRPPPGEITWVEEDITSVSTSGPALTISVDFMNLRARNREQVVVVRLKDVKGYFPTTFPEYTDPEANLAVSASVLVPMTGKVQQLVLVIPYITMPRDSGGITEVEVAVHEPDGFVTALDFYQIELPEDFDRTPDLLTVVTHILVAMVQTGGKLTRDEVRMIRNLLISNFSLDELGDQALRRILKIAARTAHSPETLAEAIKHTIQEQHFVRLVNIVYASAEADGVLSKREQRFIEELLDLCEIHDHKRYGPERLAPSYEELELSPGANLAEVRQAYKQLVRDYHPDRVHNLARGFQEFATEKTTRLNDAYHQLRAYLERTHAEVSVEIDEADL
ncbi:MAG: TerB family tellurite resistance protein [Deltaproteobacteria bacterium]|nr:TerB family tellurite resistance protein [Deltaproteobacteria bacterium]MBW2253890.1 TerB family tellurite resistance protein [Deltaproteobacteria bacterium]